MFYIVSDIHGEKNRMYLAWNPYLGYHWVGRKEINDSNFFAFTLPQYILHSNIERR